MRCPILMYHQIDVPPPSGTPLRGLVVSPAAFARQMALLALLGYRGVSMGELLSGLHGEHGGKLVGITFDDGYLNNLEHAAPVLARHGFGATCYVVANAVGGRNAWDAGIGVPDKPLMDAAHLRQWQAAGLEIGSHTLDHVDLTAVLVDEARRQIAGSRDALQDLLGTPVQHFCYPYGRYGAEHRALAQEAGYLTATTTRRGRAQAGDDLLQLRRVLVAQATHPGYFLLKLLTAYEDRRG